MITLVEWGNNKTKTYFLRHCWFPPACSNSMTVFLQSLDSFSLKKTNISQDARKETLLFMQTTIMNISTGCQMGSLPISDALDRLIVFCWPCFCCWCKFWTRMPQHGRVGRACKGDGEQSCHERKRPIKSRSISSCLFYLLGVRSHFGEPIGFHLNADQATGQRLCAWEGKQKAPKHLRSQTEFMSQCNV